jgi:hypothetical protein
MTDFTNLAALVAQGQSLLDLVKGGQLAASQAEFDEFMATSTGDYDGKIAQWAAAVQANLAAAPVRYKVLYVDSTGDDGNTGNSLANAFLTLDKALSLCTGMHMEYSIVVGAGGYTVNDMAYVKDFSRLYIVGAVNADDVIETVITVIAGKTLYASGISAAISVRDVEVHYTKSGLVPAHWDVPFKAIGAGASFKFGALGATYRAFRYVGNGSMINAEACNVEVVLGSADITKQDGSADFNLVYEYYFDDVSLYQRGVTADVGVTI